MDLQLAGDYAAYIWPAYGLTILVMLALLAFSITRLKRVKRELGALEQAQGGRRRRRGDAASDAEDEET